MGFLWILDGYRCGTVSIVSESLIDLAGLENDGFDDVMNGSSVGNMVNRLYSFSLPSSLSITAGGSGADLSGEDMEGTWPSEYEPNSVGVLNGRCLRGAACLVGDIRPAGLRLRPAPSSGVVGIVLLVLRTLLVGWGIRVGVKFLVRLGRWGSAGLGSNIPIAPSAYLLALSQKHTHRLSRAS